MEVFPTVSSCESARHLLHLWVGLLLPLNGPALKPRLPRPGYLAWERGGGQVGSGAACEATVQDSGALFLICCENLWP